MALIKCSDCGREVSDRAAACLQCGAPIAATSPAADMGRSVHHKVEIEATNRGLKNQMLLAVCCALGGCVGIVGSTGSNSVAGIAIFSLLCVGGLVWFLVARIMAWHRNG